jgi:hypothetical protein
MSYVYNKSRTSQGPIVPYRFVKPGNAAYTAVQAAAPSDSILGVSLQFTNVTQVGQRFDFAVFGPAQIELGANVADGDLLTTDSEGRGITAVRHAHTENTAAAYTENATTAAAVPVRVGAIALQSGVVGDIIDVVVLPLLA